VRYERGITQLLDILIKTFDLSTSVEDYRGKLFAIYLMEGECMIKNIQRIRDLLITDTEHRPYGEKLKKIDVLVTKTFWITH